MLRSRSTSVTVSLVKRPTKNVNEVIVYKIMKYFK